jgi:N-acyl-D-amino-acid deacylase
LQGHAADPDIPRESIPDVSPHFQDSYGDPLLFRRDLPLPMTGDSPACMKGDDAAICSLLKHSQVPGCAVAIAQHGKLLFARGYGWADIKSNQPVMPNSFFRIASISKSLTAVATLKLCEEQRLTQDTKAFTILHYPPVPDERPDMRLNKITIRDLLQCSAGWNRDQSGDAMFCPDAPRAAELMSATLRPTAESAIRCALSRPLDFEPGTHHSYSNLCYAILGQIIAKIAGVSYEEYVRDSILNPMGIKGMRLGKTLVAADGEVTYYPFPGEENSRSMFPNYLAEVPLSYGGDFALEANQSDAGWIASAPELAKFACTLFGDKNGSPISAGSISEMLKRPDLPEWRAGQPFFAEGWEVYPNSDPQKVIFCRRGNLPGSEACVSRRADGTTVAWVANSRPEDAEEFVHEMLKRTWKAADNLKVDRPKDLFEIFD